MALLENKESAADVFACERATGQRGKVVTFALNRTEFDKIFGLYAKQYKAWYKAVRDLQKQRQKGRRVEDGTLSWEGTEDIRDLQEKLKHELTSRNLNTGHTASDLEQICKKLIVELGHDVSFKKSENAFIATMLADEKSENFAKFEKFIPATPVSFLVIALSITAYVYDSLTTPGCDLPELQGQQTGPVEYNCRFASP